MSLRGRIVEAGIQRNMNFECRIKDDKNLVIIPLDPGSPPSWYPAFAGVEGIYVPREQFDKLKELRLFRPCEYCPDKVKSMCETSKSQNLEESNIE